MDDEDDDIFHMLLKENKVKTKKVCQTGEIKTGRIPSKVDTDLDVKDDDLPFDLKFSIDSSSRSLIKTESESRVLEHVYEQTLLVLDNCSDENFVYVLVDNDGVAVVQIYRLGCDKIHKPKIAAYLETSMKSALFRDKDRPGNRHLYIINQLSSHDTANAAHTHNGLSIQSGNVYLPTITYASLFGKTTGLVKSPVVLLCTNDGCVFWRPVKSIEQNGKFYLMCQLHDLVNCVLSLSLNKKSNIDEVVATSLHSALMMTDGEADDGHNGLFVVNCIGECCLLLPTPRLTSRYEQLPVRFCLPHPIVCCIQGGKQFIYSTGWSVESATLCLKQDENRMSITLEHCTTLKLAKIERLFYSTTDFESGPRLMGLTSDLDKIYISMPTSSNAAISSPATHLLPDTIQRIQQHASSIQQFQNISNALDLHLVQLNMFANLYQQNQQKQIGTDIKSSSLIHCDCFLDHSQGYSKNSEIRIQLRNNSAIDLSNQWSVLMTVIQECYFLKDNNIFTDSFCFKMEMGFHSGCLKTFSVPLPEHFSADPLSKLRIHVSLILCVSQEVVNQSSVILFPTCNLDNMLEVEIHIQVLDYLHILRVSIDADLSLRRNTSHSIEELKAVLERLNGNKLNRNQIDSVIERKEKTMSKILVPDLNDQDFKPDVKEEVLRLLLHNVPIFSNDNGPLSISCQSPSGAEICLILEKTQAITDGGKMLHLRLESCDVILLCVIHIALLERFKIMVKNGRISPSTKIDLENQLSELKAVGSYLSNNNSKLDDMTSNFCKVLDCLGKCIQ